MEQHEDGWLYDGHACDRLWNKSAIGRPTHDGKLILADSEVIFCKDHRGLKFPDSEWLTRTLQTNVELLDEAAILEALRVPGNKVILNQNLVSLQLEHSVESWALRWPSDAHPNKDSAVSEIRWFHALDGLVVTDLLTWCTEVNERGRIAEVLVVDEEQSVVTYRLMAAEPLGNLEPPDSNVFNAISSTDYVETSTGGAFYPDIEDWSCESIGIPLHGGRQLDWVERELIHTMGQSNWDFSVDSFSKRGVDPNHGMTVSASLLQELWNRGLNTRPGFKYGTTWRCYPGDVGEGHAPWLVIDPEEIEIDDWAQACLSSRLASGVNKHWLYPVFDNEVWRFLEISRPPSDSRWNNPLRR